MQGMTKKKRPGSQPEPNKGERPPHKMVRVPLELYNKLQEKAKRHRRPLSWEHEIALEFYLEHGPEPDQP